MNNQFKLFENESLILYVVIKEDRPKTQDLLLETEIHLKLHNKDNC